MKFTALILLTVSAGVIMGVTRWVHPLTSEGGPPPAVIQGDANEEEIARGKYLIMTSGCNDCHTPGFMQQGLKVPESEWLTGVPVGWQGPWGTTYGANLRQHLAAYPDVRTWISMIRSREGLPPMPWPSLHSMTDADLTAIHFYISSLPVTGSVMPAALPPGVMPSTPYLVMQPVMPASDAAKNAPVKAEPVR